MRGQRSQLDNLRDWALIAAVIAVFVAARSKTAAPTLPESIQPKPIQLKPRRDWIAWLGVSSAILAAVGALIFNGVSANSASHQIDLTRQGQLTDRYSNAVAQLGSDSIDVRLGGIYALESLMRDSPIDQPTIVEVLAAYIRDHVDNRAISNRVPQPSNPGDLQRPTDVLAAFTVLGRRDTRFDPPRNSVANLPPPPPAVDLSFANLSDLDLTQVNLAGFDLNLANLSDTDLPGANLSGANLASSNFSGAYLADANLTCAFAPGADFDGARADHVNLSEAWLTGASFVGADLTGANLHGAINAVLSTVQKASANGGTETSETTSACSY
jgi:hypothetical protein